MRMRTKILIALGPLSVPVLAVVAAAWMVVFLSSVCLLATAWVFGAKTMMAEVDEWLDRMVGYR